MMKFACYRVRTLQRRFGQEPDLSIARRRRRWSTGVVGRSGHDESGAVLILALVFLVTVSVIVGALTDWTTNNLHNTANFNATQLANSNATNAVNLGIQNVRYTPLLYNYTNNTLTDLTLNASPPSYCWGSATSPSQAFNMNVYCSTGWNPTSANTRQVTVSACPISRTAPITGTASWTAAQSSCFSQPTLQALVTFDDYPPGVSAPSQFQCAVYCGSSLTLNSWNWNPSIPTVTNVLGTSGTIDGGQPMTITGTGFTSNSTVNFVDTDPLAQVENTATQQIVPAKVVSVNTATQTISAQSPGVTTLANYYITVTTPGGGTSAINAQHATFDYSSYPPAVTNVTPTSGYTTHGTAITITGSGFINGATVSMVQESGGTPTTPSTIYAATAVQVVSNTEITAITYPVPPAGLGTSYFITVTTAAGASQYTGSAVFTFTQAPP